jgi:DNA ligase-1
MTSLPHSIPKLYKLDSMGRTRVWCMEQEDDRYRTYDGILDGTIKVSAWRTAKPTNVGRANERNGAQQAEFEIQSAYQKKLKGAYYEDVNDIHLGCRYFEVMLAEVYNDPKRQKQTAFEVGGFGQPKLDGMRMVGKNDGGWSREGEPVAGVGHILEVLHPLLTTKPDLIFDGELYNHELKEDFNEILSLAKKANPSPERAQQIRDQIQYHVYDLPSHPGVFEERHAELAQIVAHINHPSLVLVEAVKLESEAHFDELHGICLEAGYEGSMFRRNTVYINDRTDNLLKRKDFMDHEFRLLRVEAGHRGAFRAVCQLEDGREFGAGIKGSRAKAAQIAQEDHQIVTVNFFGYTPAGIPRFPIATKFHGAERTT